MLAELMRLKYGIAVAGTHGKTTTTSILGSLLSYCKVDPTVVIGGRLNRWGTNAKLGQGDIMVAEADESDGSFNLLPPTLAIVTNIDNDHLDHYKNFSEIKKAFLTFLNRIPFYGAGIVCGDDPHVRSILKDIKKKVITYGLGKRCDVQAKNIQFQGVESSFDVVAHGKKLGNFKIKAPGLHNVRNALSCIIAALKLNLPVSKIKQGLKQYTGVQRRFQIRGQHKGFTVLDDYGHHPTEIKATLETCKKVWPKRRLFVAFQPHRYSRTRDCFKQFTTCFEKADFLLLTDIYPAGEKAIPGISGEKLFHAIHQKKKNSVFCSNRKIISHEIEKHVRPGDVVLTLGAGDIWKSGEEFLQTLKKGPSQRV